MVRITDDVRRRQPAGRATMGALVLGLLATACGGAADTVDEVPEEVLAQERARILEPFLNEERPVEILSDHLVITITPNFVQDLTRPGSNPGLHEFTVDDKDGYTQYRWLNPRGLDGAPFTFYVRQSKIYAVYSARLRVLDDAGRQPLTFTVEATGNAAVSRGNEDARDGLQQVTVKDGVLSVQ